MANSRNLCGFPCGGNAQWIDDTKWAMWNFVVIQFTDSDLLINECICAHAFLTPIKQAVLLHNVKTHYGCAIAQAANLRLSTAVARVRSPVKSCGICGEQNDNGERSFPRSSIVMIRCWYNKLSSSWRRIKWTQSPHLSNEKNTIS